MRPEDRITAGKSITEALTAFREGVNQLGPPRALGQCLALNLDHIGQLLSEPITQEEAQALLDVLYKRHWMEELLRWLTDRPVTWEDFPAYETNLREEAKRQWEEMKRKWAADRERRSNVQLVPDDGRFPKIADSCPDCGSSEWKPIVYGNLSEEGRQAARDGEFIWGGSIMEDASRHCTSCLNDWPTKPDVSKPNCTPEAIADSRTGYASLAAQADLPSHPDEPVIERAWARIDGTVRFLARFGHNKVSIRKNLD